MNRILNLTTVLILAISCSSQPSVDNDITKVNQRVLSTIQNDNYEAFKDIISKRTNPIINDYLLSERFFKAQKLLTDFPNSSNYRLKISTGKMSAESVFGEVEYTQVITILDSVKFREDTFQTSIEFKFTQEPGRQKILALNIMDGRELIVLQRHLKNLQEGKECKSDCPFH